MVFLLDIGEQSSGRREVRKIAEFEALLGLGGAIFVGNKIVVLERASVVAGTPCLTEEGTDLSIGAD